MEVLIAREAAVLEGRAMAPSALLLPRRSMACGVDIESNGGGQSITLKLFLQAACGRSRSVMELQKAKSRGWRPLAAWQVQTALETSRLPLS